MCLPAGGFDHFGCGRAARALQESEDLVFSGLRLWHWGGLCDALPTFLARHIGSSPFLHSSSTAETILYIRTPKWGLTNPEN